LAKSHYENFPVISLLVKKELRKDVAIIYWFARTADDIADEGELSAEKRLEKLSRFEKKLSDSLSGFYPDEFWAALHNTIIEKNISPQNLFNLLKAFKQDVTKNRFINFEEILEYCSNSANPVGRIILELHDIRTDSVFNLSDKVCTALQLTNFYQDVKIDLKKNRIYIPLDELKKYQIEENSLAKSEINPNFVQLMKFQVERNRQIYREGEEIIKYLSGRLKYQIKWTILGGMAILSKIEDIKYNVIKKRPVHKKSEYAMLMLKALFTKI
ncbi:MAG: squalene synthase HpnC, partial [Bacteroidetes bacterium]|nr:squalene synthase HpnC [Bacteroidota bacterium]